jgi:O-acetyl-ADP-ribose deacetylase (regulator of RNase III)
MPNERIRFVQGDVTREQVDAFANAANPGRLGGGGVDGAIHRAAGPQLLEYCRTLGGCPAGQARISPGCRLAAQWIIRTVCPAWQGGKPG